MIAINLEEEKEGGGRGGRRREGEGGKGPSTKKKRTLKENRTFQKHSTNYLIRDSVFRSPTT